MIVSELAQRAGVPAHVARYYARIGLLKPNRHPENGYKLFRRDDIHRIHFIRQANGLGFKLNEIDEFLDQAYQGKSVCPDVRIILKQRIAQNKAEIDQLQRQLANMEGALRRWQHIPDGAPSEDVLCPLIESGFH
jgi:MerR family Zn(II)-responsive transcriptional regulator of zntA